MMDDLGIQSDIALNASFTTARQPDYQLMAENDPVPEWCIPVFPDPDNAPGWNSAVRQLNETKDPKALMLPADMRVQPQPDGSAVLRNNKDCFHLKRIGLG